MKTLMATIYAARIDPPPEGLRIRYAAAIERYLQDTHTIHAKALNSLLSLNFQNFQKAQKAQL